MDGLGGGGWGVGGWEGAKRDEVHESERKGEREFVREGESERKREREFIRERERESLFEREKRNKGIPFVRSLVQTHPPINLGRAVDHHLDHPRHLEEHRPVASRADGKHELRFDVRP